MDRVHRRMAAILAADVAGYSRLMGQDEEGTVVGLRAHREVVDRLGLQLLEVADFLFASFSNQLSV